jgi:hypothetical protein
MSASNIFKDFTQGRPSVNGPVVRSRLDQATNDPHMADVPGSFKWPGRDVKHVPNADDRSIK